MHQQRQAVEAQITTLSEQGLRVIAVSSMSLADGAAIPQSLNECQLNFCGLVGLYDPPRANIQADIALCTKAGIRVVMITGDNGQTASSIAQKIGISNSDAIVTGDMLEQMSDAELREKVKTTSIFSRVIPEHKMRIVKAFQDNGEIVAMTGDGVNDAPALKHADIGIAMGQRGSEVSREAADIILMDDNFSTIVDTVKDGRRIYANIKKAVGYVFAIHMPIALVSLCAPLFGIDPANLLLLPLHVALLELVIDPTCSVVLERQPAELDLMQQPPRQPQEKLVNFNLLLKSFLQGLIIFAACFGSYLVLLQLNPTNSALARSMGLTVLLVANIFLVQVNSSESDTTWHVLKRLFQDKVIWLSNLAVLLLVLLMLYTPLNSFLKLEPLSLPQLLSALLIAALAVFWYDLVKLLRAALANKKS